MIDEALGALKHEMIHWIQTSTSVRVGETKKKKRDQQPLSMGAQLDQMFDFGAATYFKKPMEYKPNLVSSLTEFKSKLRSLIKQSKKYKLTDEHIKYDVKNTFDSFIGKTTSAGAADEFFVKSEEDR